MLLDARGDLWLSSNRGLTRFAPGSPHVDNFSPQDGLQSFEFSDNAAMRTSSGQMFFGGVNGLNSFHPDSIRQSTHAVPVVLTALNVFNQPVRPGPDSPLATSIESAGQIVLEHWQTVFTLEFAALVLVQFGN